MRRLSLFAFGDFAFNRHWQSIMPFLLFYYTDALNLPIGIAATTIARRAREERAAAMKAARPEARKAHLEMAERYDDLATARDARKTLLGLHSSTLGCPLGTR